MKQLNNDMVMMSGMEAKEICKMGKESKCCAFLVASLEGFACIRMDIDLSRQIKKRLEENTITAKGVGGWEGCYWEGDIPDGDKTIKEER